AAAGSVVEFLCCQGFSASQQTVSRAWRPMTAIKESCRAVMVDDDEDFHFLTCRAFNRASPGEWTLDDFLGPEEAMKQITGAPPQAVLMDIAMPGLSGID